MSAGKMGKVGMMGYSRGNERAGDGAVAGRIVGRGDRKRIPRSQERGRGAGIAIGREGG